VIADEAAHFAQSAWDRAVRGADFLDTAWPDVLVLVIDSEGAENQWVERSSSGGSDSHPGLAKLHKRVSKQIAEADAAAVAIAQWFWHKSWRTQSEWLLLVAVHEAGNAGYKARVERGGDGSAIVGDRAPWQWASRSVKFDADLSQLFDPIGNATAQALRRGLDDARKRRRRQTPPRTRPRAPRGES
jgi:hypothetical protein